MHLKGLLLGSLLGSVLGTLIWIVPGRKRAARAARLRRIRRRTTPPVLPSDDDDDEELIVETRDDASPAHFITKIDFSLFSDLRIRKYETGEFEAGDHKWKLIIYPNGHPSKRSSHVSVYLALAETSSLPQDWQLNAIFTIFLYNQILDNYLCFRGNTRCFTKIKSEWGFPIKCLRNKSSGYLADGNLVCGVEVFVLSVR